MCKRLSRIVSLRSLHTIEKDVKRTKAFDSATWCFEFKQSLKIWD